MKAATMMWPAGAEWQALGPAEQLRRAGELLAEAHERAADGREGLSMNEEQGLRFLVEALGEAGYEIVPQPLQWRRRLP